MRKILAMTVGFGLACTGAVTDAPPPPAPAGGVGLLPASELVTDCFDWPTRDFSKKSHAEIGTRLTTGDRAVDFTLQDTRGTPVRLADLLDEKPVLLVEGSLTCPRFQESRLDLEQLVRRNGDALQVVLAYNVEAHPAGNDPSPYKGRPWPKETSTRGQPKTYDERVLNAREVARDTAMKVVVDSYDSPGANPIWCTYGTCANCAWLVRRDGTIAAHQEWHDLDAMQAAIDRLLAEAP